MSISYVKRTRIDYTRPARQPKTSVGCLHHDTLTRVQVAGDVLRSAGLTPRTPDLSRLPACTCR